MNYKTHFMQTVHNVSRAHTVGACHGWFFGWSFKKLVKYAVVMSTHHSWKKSFAPCGLIFYNGPIAHAFDNDMNIIPSLSDTL